MFRTTSPQRPLFGVEHRLDEVKRARMEKTWAQPYRMKALGLIDEKRFAMYFDPANGRPNKSVRLVVSILVLKEVFDLTDEEALARGPAWSGTCRGTTPWTCCRRRRTRARRRCTTSASCCSKTTRG